MGRGGWALLFVALCCTGCGDEGGDDGDGGSDGGDDGPTYCDVEPITHGYCTRCHSDPPDPAPFPLVTYADTQVDHGSGKRYEVMADMVESEIMPPVGWDAEPPVEGLTAEQRQVIIDWAEAGAPSGGCD